MFVTEATTLLAHPLPQVAAVLGRVRALPRWCGGMRRAHGPGGDMAGARGPSGCTLVYDARVVRLVLAARTLPAPDGPRSDVAIAHVAEGEGVALGWTFRLHAEASGDGASLGAGTRLHARTTLDVDAGHPTAAYRVILARLIARRSPDDLARLAALLERSSERPRPAVGPPAVSGPVVAPPVVAPPLVLSLAAPPAARRG